MINVLQTTQNKIIIKNFKTMKEEIIKQIHELMEEHHIYVNEVVEYRRRLIRNDHQPFDLLCVCSTASQLFRTTFEKGKNLHPIAIFPFANNNISLFLHECGPEQRCFVAEQDVPSVEYWKSIDAIKDELNQKLKELGAPIVDGVYFAGPPAGGIYANWLVDFQDGKAMEAYNCSFSEWAKFRACSPYLEKV